jgi:hypothetical protein
MSGDNVACDYGMYSSCEKEKRNARAYFKSLKTKINVMNI